MKTATLLLFLLINYATTFAQWTYERRDGTRFYDTIYVRKVKDPGQYTTDNFPLFRDEVKRFIAGAKNKRPHFDSCLYVVDMYNPGEKEGAFCFTITCIFQLHDPFSSLKLDTLAYSNAYKYATYMLRIDSDYVLFNKGEPYVKQWFEKKHIAVIDSDQRARMTRRLIKGPIWLSDGGGPAFFYYWFDGTTLKRRGTFRSMRHEPLTLYFQDKGGNFVDKNPNDVSYDKPSINFDDGSPEKEID